MRSGHQQQGLEDEADVAARSETEGHLPGPARRQRASDLGIHFPHDRYVPVRSEHLAATLAGDENLGSVAADLAELTEAMDTVVGQETLAFQRLLARIYEPFNPVRETVAVDDADSTSDGEHLKTMIDYLLDKANYERLDEVQIETAVQAANSHGMRIRVKPERIESLELYVRGRTEGERRVRTVRRPVKGELRRIELYRRLAVVFRMRGEQALNLKLFREIPVADIEALLPHAEVAMTSVDQVKIVGGGLGALGGVATNIFNSVVEGTVLGSQFLWAGVAAMLGLSVRSFLGYRRARLARNSQMTHHLYFQNVANNAGMLELLAANIAQEELKEAMLAYALLAADHAREGEDKLRSMEALEGAVQAWLMEHFGVDVDFDGPDALETLERLELWEDPSDWRLVPPREAIRRLQAYAGSRSSGEYHLRAIEGRKGVDGPE